MTAFHSRPAIGALAGALAFGLLGIATTTARAADDDRPVIQSKPETPIKVVFQITSPDAKDGLNKGLLALKHLHGAYLAAGVDPKEIDVRGVFHGAAADHLLADDAWNRLKNQTGGNPNSALIAELTRAGVHVELCDARRIANKWAKSDVHADVLLASDAFQRLVELQRRGYAYIRY